MTHTDRAIRMLDLISSGDLTLDDNISKIKEQTISIIESSDTVICCGTLPFSRKFAQKMVETKKCYYLDSGDGEGMYAGCPLVSVTDLDKLKECRNIAYVIMSRSMLEFYNYIIKKTDSSAHILYYPTVELSYEDCFSGLAREDYTPAGIKKAVRHIHENAEEIKENLLAFKDEISKEIYSRIVLFRATFDMELNIGVKSDKTEYLDDDIICWKYKEHMVDMGGYVGDTLYDFREYFCEKGIDFEYYLLEPSEANCREAATVAGDSPNVHICHCCAGDENKIVYLGSTMGSAITVNLDGKEDGEATQMVRLDDMMCGKKVTYIKMDIEGSEEIALRGAVNVIQENRPKLAVCIYHKYNDITDLVGLVKDITQKLGYDYYVRAQRESVVTEMVLYAIPRD